MRMVTLMMVGIMIMMKCEELFKKILHALSLYPSEWTERVLKLLRVSLKLPCEESLSWVASLELQDRYR